MREGYESRSEESNIMFFFRPPRNLQLIKINQYNYNYTVIY